MTQVSILMPVFNAESFLDDCIISIIDQSFKDWELIAVDDFSEDGSYEKLEAYAQYDERIKVYENPKKGIIPALRKAFKMSSGTYITRMDADDIMPTYKLERLVEGVREKPDHCITGKVRYFSDDELGEGYAKYADWLNSLVDDQSHYDHIYKECVIPSPCWMVSRVILAKAGAFNESRYPEDYDLVFRMYKSAISVYGLDAILHLWRDHGSRASRNDDHYKNQSFTEIKLHYFIELAYDAKKSLYLWGAGTTAKDIAKRLIARELSFHWISNNPKKIGHNIYGVIVEGEEILLSTENSQVIIAIKEKNFKEENRKKITAIKTENEVYEFH